MARWVVKKRTFEAKKYPKGSEERKELNRNVLTSEYNSNKFVLVDEDTGTYETFKSLGLANFSKSEWEKYNK